MAAGSIVIDLLMKTGSFETDTKRAEKRLREFQKSASMMAKTVAAAGVAIGASMVYMTKKTIDNMDQMAKMAQQAGVTVEALSSLGYAADLSGLSTQEMTRALGLLSKGLADASSGTGEALKAFQRMNIDLASLTSADGAMLKIADQFAMMQDGAEKTSLAIQLFGGRIGQRLIPFLNQGADGISKMQREADLLGITIRTNAAKAAEEFNDNLTRLTAIGQGLFNQFATALLPVLVDITGAMFAASVETDETNKAANDLTKNELPSWIKGLALSFGYLADTVIGTLGLFGSMDRIFEGFGKRLDYVKLTMKELALMAKTPLIGDTPEYLIEQQKAISSRKIGISMDIRDINDQVEKAVKPFGMFISDSIKKSFSESFTPIDLAFSGRGGGAGRGVTTISSTASKTKTELEKQASEYYDFINEITGRTEREALRQKEIWLKSARDAKEITEEQYETALNQLRGVESQMSQFAVQAARNIESVLGDGLYNVMTGRFSDIGDAFANMINRMISDVMASQIGQLLFGNYGTTNAIGGLIGQLGTFIGSAFSGTTTPATQLAPSGSGIGPSTYFADGGYTGLGGKYEPAGVVHRGEYVLNADATKRLGVGFLDRLNKGYANGGYVGTASSAMGGNVNINIKNEAGRDGYTATASANKNQSGLNIDVIIKKAISNDLRNNGTIAQQMSSTFGLRRTI